MNYIAIEISNLDKLERYCRDTNTNPIIRTTHDVIRAMEKEAESNPETPETMRIAAEKTTLSETFHLFQFEDIEYLPKTTVLTYRYKGRTNK